MSVFQEQSSLLYVIAGLLVVLIVIGVGVYIRLGELRDALTIRPPTPSLLIGPQRDKPVVRPAHQGRGPGPVTSAYYGGKPPKDLETRG